MKLYINTFGEFDMFMGDQSIMQDASRSYKLFKLLQYFLTFKNKKLLPETIIDNLWQEQDSSDPKNMIRGQIFRLRQILKSILPNEEYLNIVFNNGYYTLEVGENVMIDADQMEIYIQNGNNLMPENREAAIEAYLEATRLYKGTYLWDNSYEMWLVPVRSFYKRLYVKTIENLVSLYTETDDSEAIVNLCEDAIAIEPYEEKLHIFMIEGLLKMGKIKNALSHYDFMQVAFEKDLGITSTSAMKDIHRRILNYSSEKSDLEITELDKKLEEKDKSGPLLCDAEYFKFLYNSNKRKRVDNGQPDFITLISMVLTDRDDDGVDYTYWNRLMTEVLSNTLRKGDIYTFWNDSQVLVMLTDCKTDGIGIIEKRIKTKYEELGRNRIRIKLTSKPIDKDRSLSEQF
ncbi:MAG: BTAD domain-containing putative transcriptional regulator [Gudongella sp.]|jgi:DNA-binding SARP family transcriptional activator|nr:BTAD domain-containing putative transcriptional regulator [Gudongella sp.]